MLRSRFLLPWLTAAAALAWAGSARAEDRLVAPPVSIAAPSGFADLLADEEAIFDVYMGGVRATEARATYSSSSLKLADARSIVTQLSDIADADRVVAALSGALDPHRALVCARTRTPDCGVLRPEIAGIIVDRDHYRIDLFVNPSLLTVKAAAARNYLPAPQSAPSLVNAVSGVVSGSIGMAPRLYVEDSAIVSFGAARLRSNVSYSTGYGLRTDTLVAELDRPDLRFSAGAFWLPGNELLGRRKVLGIGVASQTDTRLDRDQFEGIPLIVFLDSRSRVDVLVDGHLASSRLYDAGNQGIDTARLPEGSYELTLRITAPSGSVREERRFFSRTRSLPALGVDQFLAYGGLLVDSDHGLVGHVTRTPFAQGSWSRRLGARTALRIGAIVTDHHQWIELGGTVLGKSLRLDAMVMANRFGDHGAFVHLSSTGGGRLSYDLDIRRVDAGSGRALLPATQAINSGLSGSSTTLPFGSYTQASGAATWSLGQSRVSLVGSFRRQGGSTSYSIGPSLQVPILRREHFDLVANADFAQTDVGRRGFVGISLRLHRGRNEVTAQSSMRMTPRPGQDDVAPSWRLAASTQRDDVMGAQVQASASLEQQDGDHYATLQTEARHRLGFAALGLVQPIGGRGTTQYGLTFGTNLAARQGYLGLSGKTGGDALVVAQVDGAAPDDRFDVLVNDVPVASLTGARALSFPLPSYRAYDVRLKARGGKLADYDSSPRRIGLYPGNVAGFRWTTRPLVAAYGRLVRAGSASKGAAVGGANLSAGREVATSDEAGTFLIQLPAGEAIVAHLMTGETCTARPVLPSTPGEYVQLGDVACVFP